MSRVLIIGPGALGAFTAVRLAHAGHDVTVGCRTKDTAEHIREHGVVAVDGGQRVRAQVAARVRPGGGPYDVIIHATKCHGAAKILAKWMGRLEDGGIVIPFQNGVMGDELMAVAGDAYVECSVYFPATLESTGVSIKTGPGHFIVGHWPTGKVEAGDKAHRAAEMLEAVLPTHTHDDMRAVKWNKLAINSAITAFGVITGQTMAGMMEDRATVDAFLRCVKESISVIKAADIPMVSVGGANLGLLAALPPFVTKPVLRSKMRKYKDYRSSSAQSLARGQKTEIPFLNGLIAARGDEVGVETPVHDAIVTTVEAIEAGSLQPSAALVGKRILAA